LTAIHNRGKDVTQTAHDDHSAADDLLLDIHANYDGPFEWDELDMLNTEDDVRPAFGSLVSQGYIKDLADLDDDYALIKKREIADDDRYDTEELVEEDILCPDHGAIYTRPPEAREWLEQEKVYHLTPRGREQVEQLLD